jgi:hypothetical protein
MPSAERSKAKTANARGKRGERLRYLEADRHEPMAAVCQFYLTRSHRPIFVCFVCIRLSPVAAKNAHLQSISTVPVLRKAETEGSRAFAITGFSVPAPRCIPNDLAYIVGAGPAGSLDGQRKFLISMMSDSENSW